MNTIDRLGLGKEVENLLIENKTHREISAIFEKKYPDSYVSPSTIYRWIKESKAEAEDEEYSIDRITGDINQDTRNIMNDLEAIKEELYKSSSTTHRDRRRFDKKFNALSTRIENQNELLKEEIGVFRSKNRWYVRDLVMPFLVRFQQGCCSEDKKRLVKTINILVEKAEEYKDTSKLPEFQF